MTQFSFLHQEVFLSYLPRYAPSLKIKRYQVETFYQDLVHGLVAKVEKVVWA